MILLKVYSVLSTVVVEITLTPPTVDHATKRESRVLVRKTAGWDLDSDDQTVCKIINDALERVPETGFSLTEYVEDNYV